MRFGQFKSGAGVTPFAADYLKPLDGSWKMLGNDHYGDCEAVRWANHRFLITSTLTGTPHYPSQNDVFTVYRTQNPNFVPDPHDPVQDNGMDSLTLLDYLHKQGGPDGAKVVAYATIDTSDLAEVQYAIDVFGAVWLDIIVLEGNQQQFDDGVPWTDDHSKIDGGHAVLAGGAPVGNKKTDVDIETWAAETALTPSFWKGSVQGHPLVTAAYVVIWPGNLGTRQFAEGVDLAALQAAYTAVTGGKTLDVPSPAPTPTPAGAGKVAFTADQRAALDAWAASPHSFHHATVAAAAWKDATKS
jgi:hypothetical protein